MEWTETHDLILAKEVRASEPWIFKARTVDRGKVWNAITDRLNDETSVKFQVKKKNVQEHFFLSFFLSFFIYFIYNNFICNN